MTMIHTRQPIKSRTQFERSFGSASSELTGAARRRVSTMLDTEVAKGRIPGLQYIFADSNSVLFHHEAGLASVAAKSPVAESTTFNGFSITKTITAVAILQLRELALIDLDHAAGRYLQGFPYPPNITVRQLLTHTAGVPNPIPLRWTHLQSEHAQFDRSAFFATQFLRHGKVKVPPGQRFAYSNLGYHLLGAIIERVAGMTYEKFVRDNILDPIGAQPEELGFEIDERTHARGYHSRKSWDYPILGFLLDKRTAFEGRDGVWQLFKRYYMNGVAYGGLIGNARGFARFAQALLSESSPILSRDSISELFAEHHLKNGGRTGSALSWFTGNAAGMPFVDHAGGGGGYYAELRIYPTRGYCSVLMMNRSGMSNARILSKVDVPFLRLDVP